MTDRDDLLTMFLLSFGIVAIVFTASHHPAYYDPRWLSTAFLGVIMITSLYRAAWAWEAKENVKRLYGLLVGEGQEIRPGLRGAVGYLKGRVREIWRLGD